MNFQNTAHVLLFNAHCAASMKCLHSYIEENLEKPVKGGTGWTIWASNGWEIFLIWKTPRLALGTTQPPNQQIPTFLLIFESAQHVSGKHLPETCWADSKINKIVIFASSWSFTLFTYIDDARSNTNQIPAFFVRDNVVVASYSSSSTCSAWWAALCSVSRIHWLKF